MKRKLFLACFLLLSFYNFASAAAFKVEVTGKGQPLLLIPGLGCSGEVWQETVAKYSKNYQCHVFTLAGFAGVPAQNGPLLQTAKTEILQYIKQQKLKNSIVMGHSIGGYLTLMLAAEEPKLFAKTIIVDALPFFPDTFSPPVSEAAMQQAPVEAMVKQSVALSPEVFKDYQRRTIQTMVSDPARIEQALKWNLASDRATMVRAAYEMMQHDLRNEISKITAPTLVLGSYYLKDQPQQTEQPGLSTFKQQYAKLNKSKILVNNNARHFLMYDDPTWFFNQIDLFLKES